MPLTVWHGIRIEVVTFTGTPHTKRGTPHTTSRRAAMLGMSLTPRLRLIQTQSATETVFPAVERLLEETEYQKALKYVSFRKDQDRYRSVVDFLFVELMGGKWKAACFRYYDDGCLLKDDPRVTPEMLSEWEKQICIALEVAWNDMDEERTRSWKDFRKRWLRRLAA